MFEVWFESSDEATFLVKLHNEEEKLTFMWNEIILIQVVYQEKGKLLSRVELFEIFWIILKWVKWLGGKFPCWQFLRGK